MRNLALIFLLAVAMPAATAQQPPNLRQAPAPQAPVTKPGPMRVEPNWADVRTAQQSGQVQSLAVLQRNMRQQQGQLQTQLPKFVSQAASANVGVLIPLSAARALTTELVTGKTFYNFSASYPGGMTSSVLGMCTGVRLPDDHPLVRSMQAEARQRPMLERLGERYQISATETGNQLTFSKFGCAYEIALTCETSCDANKELLDIASNLVVINAR